MTSHALRPYFVLPVKPPAEAKSRLRRDLPGALCESLAYGLFKRSVRLMRRQFPAIPVLVVSRSGMIGRCARAAGAQFLPESGSPTDLNAAAQAAADWGEAAGFDAQILVHADLPLLDAAGLRKVLRAISSDGVDVAICRAWSGGTSILATRRPSAIPFRFGVQSFELHLQEARIRGLCTRHIRHPNIEMDLDTVDDLGVISRHPAFDVRHAATGGTWLT